MLVEAIKRALGLADPRSEGSPGAFSAIRFIPRIALLPVATD